MSLLVELVGAGYVDLAELDVSNSPIGTNVEDINTGVTYYLSISNAVIDHDNAEAVLGHPELRWLKQTIPRPDIEIAPNNTYAAPAAQGGDEANDGLSWATPKLYATSAIMLVDSLGGGTANIANNTLANPVTGRGINLSGPFDVGTYPEDKGWVRPSGNPLCLNFIPANSSMQFCFGQGTVLPKGGTWLGPMLQTPGFFGGIIYVNGNFDNSFHAAAGIPAVVLGYSSELADWDDGTTYTGGACILSGGHSWASLVSGNVGNTPGVDPTKWERISLKGDVQLGVSLSAFHRFKNCAFGTIGADSGTALDIGYLFWAWFEQGSAVHLNANASGDPMLNCAVRYLSTNLAGVYSYLQYWRDFRFNQAGIYADGSTVLYCRTLFGENMMQPMVTLAIGSAGLGYPQGIFDELEMGDSTNNVCIQNNGGSLIVARDCGQVVGPAIQYTTGLWGPAPLLTEQQVGITGGIAKIQHDSARRGFGPVTSSLPNVALTLSEQIIPGTSVTGVDGRANVARTGINYQFRDTTSASLNAGDLVAFGAWIKFTTDPVVGGQSSFISNRAGTGDITINLLAPGAAAGGNQTLVHGDSGIYWANWMGEGTGQPVQPGQWAWCWAMFEVVSVEAGANVIIQADATQNHIDRPWMVYAASGTMTKAEFAELALASVGSPNVGGTINTTPPVAPAVGMPAYHPGTAAAFWDATLGVWQYVYVDNGVQVISTTPPA